MTLLPKTREQWIVAVLIAVLAVAVWIEVFAGIRWWSGAIIGIVGLILTVVIAPRVIKQPSANTTDSESFKRNRWQAILLLIAFVLIAVGGFLQALSTLS